MLWGGKASSATWVGLGAKQLRADEFLVREAAKSLSRSKEEIKRIYYVPWSRLAPDSCKMNAEVTEREQEGVGVC